MAAVGEAVDVVVVAADQRQRLAPGDAPCIDVNVVAAEVPAELLDEVRRAHWLSSCPSEKAFPDNFTAYARGCRTGEVQVGRMFVVERTVAPRFIINFPTKQHWRQPSKLDYVREGLRDLIVQVRHHAIGSIAVPPLGCGLGGLSWTDVRPLIVAAFDELPHVRVVLYAPDGAPGADEVSDRLRRPANS